MVTKLEDVKRKKRLEKHRADPPKTGDPYTDVLNKLSKRLIQYHDIQEKLLIKVQELEVRLDENEFPVLGDPISGIHFTREGPMDAATWLAQEQETYLKGVEKVEEPEQAELGETSD